jgi:hypothetical protein
VLHGEENLPLWKWVGAQSLHPTHTDLDRKIGLQWFGLGTVVLSGDTLGGKLLSGEELLMGAVTVPKLESNPPWTIWKLASGNLLKVVAGSNGGCQKATQH